ncbi:MAG TPA: hypothetical protein VFR24_15075 [Candidatus Angelobacter sp.]|nr:hypothetical protein [Candidatus Angelobacter sp.]
MAEQKTYIEEQKTYMALTPGLISAYLYKSRQFITMVEEQEHAGGVLENKGKR